MNVGFGTTAVGTLNLSGGTIAVNSGTVFAVGSHGSGTVNQTGGSVYVRGPLAPGATSGIGQLNLGRNGGVAGANQGSGTYNLSGGDFTAAQLRCQRIRFNGPGGEPFHKHL